MPETSMQPRTEPVLLFLADVSGYTSFMISHDKSLRHSQMIVGELLETLMRQVDVPLKLSGLEGDALFLYAPKGDDEQTWLRQSEHLVERLLYLFRIFSERLTEIGAYSVCRCEACSNIDRLTLKIVAHSGEALLTEVGDFPTLSGVDVITVHRLLKNSVQADQYVLMTEPAYHDLQLPEGAAIEIGTEEYDVGTLKTYIYLPEITVDYDETAIKAKFSDSNVAVTILRDEIEREYTDVATKPERGYHFNTGRAALAMNGYDEQWLQAIPEPVINSFSGMGNPFSLGELQPGEYAVDVGSGAGLDSMIAARMVGKQGHVIGVEMTEAMMKKAQAGAAELGLAQLSYRQGFAEDLPVPDGWADVILSNGVVNLSPNKERVFAEMFRVLRPGGRLQIGDITVERPIPEGARRNIDLWTN